MQSLHAVGSFFCQSNFSSCSKKFATRVEKGIFFLVLKGWGNMVLCAQYEVIFLDSVSTNFQSKSALRGFVSWDEKCPEKLTQCAMRLKRNGSCG